MNKGVHLWSVKSLRGDDELFESTLLCHNKAAPCPCYASIGVTTKKYQHLSTKKAIRGWIPYDNDASSHYEGAVDWMQNEIMTVKLDCNDWSVTYYRDSKPGKEFKREEVEPGFYYFVAVCCGNAKFGHMEIVDNPLV